jgi:hypothetical protein
MVELKTESELDAMLAAGAVVAEVLARSPPTRRPAGPPGPRRRRRRRAPPLDAGAHAEVAGL